MADIFLSYNRQDQLVARRYAEALTDAGLTVWWDVTLRSGETYDIVTENALRDAKAVVVLWSPRSVVSRWVRAEATIADRNKTLMPVTIEDCERPIMFELTQTADLTHWEGDPNDPQWQAFLDDVRRLVGNETETSNSAEVNEASAQLNTMAQPASPATKAAAAAGHRPTLAVLPFTNRSNAPEDEDFAEAVVEEITASLSQGYGLKVLAHRVMSQYRDKRIDVRTIGEEHDTDYVLEGNIRRLGGTLRIAAQLNDARDGSILWTQKFDRPYSELIELLDELVEDVIAHLGVQIQRIEFSRATQKPRAETQYDALKRCWSEIPRMTIESLERAIMHARRAVEFAPDYPLAIATLGLCLGLLYQRDGSRKPELLEEALSHADRALMVDGRNYHVLYLASLVKYYAQQWEESLQLSERAVEVNPKSPDAMSGLAGAYTRFERYDEAIELLDRADHLSPQGHMITISLINRCWVLYGMDRFEEGVEVASEILKIMPSDHTGLMLRPIFHAELGNWDLAAKDMTELRRAYPDEPLELFIGTIKTSRQTDAKRARNAELFEKIWEMTEQESQSNAALNNAET